MEAISRNPRQPRAEISSESLEELASSIRENGILQPLVLTPGEQPGTYTLIAGERRLQAARQVGLQKVPALVRSASEQQYLELALVENLIRTDLSPLETAEAYRQLVDDFGLSHEKIAHNVGKSRVSITNTLRLLKLPVEAKIALQDEQISEGHARALLTLPTKQSQIAALQTILRYSLNVRQTEDLVRKPTGQRQVEVKSPSQPPEVSALEQRWE